MNKPYAFASLFLAISSIYAQTGNPGGSQFAASLLNDLNSNAANVPIRIPIISDSLSHCDTANCGSYFPVVNWVDLLTAHVQAKWGNHGTGIITFRGNISLNSVNPQAVASTTGQIGYCTANTTGQDGINGADGPGRGCVAVGPYPASLTSGTYTYDRLNLLYQTFDCWGACSVNGFDFRIDGQDYGTAGNQDTGCCIVQQSSFPTPGGLGPHSFTLSVNPGAYPLAYLAGFEGAIGNSGVSVDNVSTAGARTGYFSAINGSTPLAEFYQVWQQAGPHVHFILMLGTNDFTFSTAQEHAAELSGLVSDILAHGFNTSQILIVSPPFENPANVPGKNQADFKAADAQVAAQYGVSYLDVCPVDSSFCNYQAQTGYMTDDGIHMVLGGQFAWATDLLRWLGL